jgi:hypothetical protein
MRAGRCVLLVQVSLPFLQLRVVELSVIGVELKPQKSFASSL